MHDFSLELNDWVLERYQLSKERISLIREEHIPNEAFCVFFKKYASFILHVEETGISIAEGAWKDLSLQELKLIYAGFFDDISPANYDASYANPVYSRSCFGDAFGKIMTWLASEIRSLIPLSLQGRISEMTAINELFIQIYDRFEESLPDPKALHQIIYWHISDYTDQTVAGRIRELLDPQLDFYKKIIMEADAGDLRYLYRYGESVSEAEIEMAVWLGKQKQETIDLMAKTMVSGYVRGFQVYGIDLGKKKNVVLRGNIGFERVYQSLIRQFADIGLDVIVYREPLHNINRKATKIGYRSRSVNPQYDYDHRLDKALYFDRALLDRVLSVAKAAYQKYAQLAADYAGPAVLQIFGEKPFEPVVSDAVISPGEKTEKLLAKLDGGLSDLAEAYIDQESISYTMIAWPMPFIGPEFEAIMEEMLKVNTLDNDLYTRVQQRIIEGMDGAEYIYIEGMNGNETDLRVYLKPLEDIALQSDFENCCADVNIPAGEVFTSPRLKDTTGLLHVSGAYLGGLYYKNLKLMFKDGMISAYHCSNYASDEENRRFIRQNLLRNHDTLPMGEFAIGTNTTAYAMAENFGITDRLPVLVMEKTGPHFAVGDTCYAGIEDMKVYNPDGREIYARENERSALKDTDPEKAYFHVHTDITIPYNEIGVVKAVFADDREVEIIKKGRFVLEGTEILNKPL